MYLIAACTFPVSESAEDEIHLLPVEQSFRANDGRPEDAPHWILPESTASKWKIEKSKVIDYEHQTLHSQQNGHPAPAAGWMTAFSIKDGFLTARTEWTSRARAMLSEREYRFISPVFRYERGTGRVVELLHAALTNAPALPQLPEIVTAAALLFPLSQEKNSVLTSINELLGLPDSATEDEIKVFLADLKARAEAAPVPLTVVTDLQQQLASASAQLKELKAHMREAEIDDLIKDGIASGKLTGERMITWARTLTIEALREFLAVAVPVAALNETQSGGEYRREGRKYDEETLSVARMLGTAEADLTKFGSRESNSWQR